MEQSQIAAIARYWPALLMIAVVVLLPFERWSGLPVLVMSVIGLVLAVRQGPSLWSRPEVRLLVLLWLCYWLPMVVGSLDAVMPSKSWTTTVAALRFLLMGLFAIQHDFPSVEPPDYLRQLNPQLYEAECQRVQERFSEAISLAETAFTSELAQLISHLTERLGGQEDGKPKVFRDSAIGNLQEFFRRFSDLNIGSNEELDRLVADAQQIVQGVQPQSLRDNAALRQHVTTEMSRVQSVLDGLLVDRPRRNILRRPR